MNSAGASCKQTINIRCSFWSSNSVLLKVKGERINTIQSLCKNYNCSSSYFFRTDRFVVVFTQKNEHTSVSLSPQQAAVTGIKPFLYHVLWWGKDVSRITAKEKRQRFLTVRTFQKKTACPGVTVQQFLLHGGQQCRSPLSEQVS